MRIIHGTTEFELEGKSAVAIGKFDGIHLGHQKLLECILEKKKNGLKAVIFTFDPPPSVLFGVSQDKELMTREEKRAAFEWLGVDVLIEFPLTYETAAILPKVFIEQLLCRQMKAAYIVAGTDVSFGAKGAGNASLLNEMSNICGYELRIIDKVCHNGKEVSSTYVREEVAKGQMEEVHKLLGAPYSIWGGVVHGNRFGRTIGMPTVNLMPSTNKLLPPNGVYYSEVYLEGRQYAGITNVGYKPTVSKELQMGVETYIYDFDKEIYGAWIGVALLGFKRTEKRFKNADELKMQMAKDIEEGKLYHNKIQRKG